MGESQQQCWVLLEGSRQPTAPTIMTPLFLLQQLPKYTRPGQKLGDWVKRLWSLFHSYGIPARPLPSYKGGKKVIPYLRAENEDSLA